MLTMAQLAQQIDRLTIEHLQIVARTLFTRPTAGRADADFVTYGLATEVLRFFFGNAWTNENVFSVITDVSPSHRSGREFFKTESTDKDEQFRHMQRVTTLGELVFNLQGIEGIRQRLALMQNDNLEAALGECECAALLSPPEFMFRFVVPTGIKGQDYEGEVLTAAERVVCCEIKSKSEQTEANPNSLWRTLDHARQQLPKGKPGIIMIKIPEVWVKQQETQSVIAAAVQRVCRQSHRVVAVVYTWEEWHSTREGWRVILTKFHVYRNNRSELYAPDIEAFLEGIGQARNAQWLSFRVFVERLSRVYS